jgi:hypothetical protein
VLDLAVRKGFHHALVQVANLAVFYRHPVEHAIIRFDYRLAVGHGSLFCVVTKLVHYLSQLINLFLMRLKARILAAHLLCHTDSDVIQTLAHVFGAFLLLHRRHHQLCKP